MVSRLPSVASRFDRHGLDAEIRRLKGEIEQRESKTAESFWQRTVASDREKARLESALDQAQAKVMIGDTPCSDMGQYAHGV